MLKGWGGTSFSLASMCPVYTLSSTRASRFRELTYCFLRGLNEDRTLQGRSHCKVVFQPCNEVSVLQSRPVDFRFEITPGIKKGSIPRENPAIPGASATHSVHTVLQGVAFFRN